MPRTTSRGARDGSVVSGQRDRSDLGPTITFTDWLRPDTLGTIISQPATTSSIASAKDVSRVIGEGTSPLQRTFHPDLSGGSASWAGSWRKGPYFPYWLRLQRAGIAAVWSGERAPRTRTFGGGESSPNRGQLSTPGERAHGAHALREQVGGRGRPLLGPGPGRGRATEKWGLEFGERTAAAARRQGGRARRADGKGRVGLGGGGGSERQPRRRPAGTGLRARPLLTPLRAEHPAAGRAGRPAEPLPRPRPAPAVRPILRQPRRRRSCSSSARPPTPSPRTRAPST